MKRIAFLLILLALGGCVADQMEASKSLGSTSSRRQKVSDDPDKPQQMCQDTSIGGESKTVCY